MSLNDELVKASKQTCKHNDIMLYTTMKQGYIYLGASSDNVSNKT